MAQRQAETTQLASVKTEKESENMNKLAEIERSDLEGFRVLALESDSLGPLLKFIKGEWFIGDTKIEIGRAYVAHLSELVHGWVKFQDGKPVEQRVGKVADKFRPAKREELGDLDRDKWETQLSGAPRDPWSLQFFLPLEDVETGEIV